MLDLLHSVLDVVRSIPFGTEWNEREASGLITLRKLAGAVSNAEIRTDDFFLGGDLLRPYLSFQHDMTLSIASVERVGLSRPKLLEVVESGQYGLPIRTRDPLQAQEFLGMQLPLSASLCVRLSVPRMYLIGLTNPSRYRAFRYPLNVSRLGQWLRFRHAARVRVVDKALTFDGDVQRLSLDIKSFAPDIVGISLNFGEISALQEIVAIIRDLEMPRPILCIGNVLAAWASEEVRNICIGFEVHISESYGECDLERVCASVVQRRNARAKPPKSAVPVAEQGPRHPQSIVVPDDHLLEKTIEHGGQVSIETSFGCQYGRCSFCPRDHRSKGWRRPAIPDAVAVIQTIASQLCRSSQTTSRVLSIVDEDVLGSEGLDPRRSEFSFIQLLRSANAQGVRCEIYTRAEQLFNRNWKESESVARLRLLAGIQPCLSRVFVGVESGSDGQLRRFSKGQTVDDVVYAVRAGCLLDLPLEFGFITFDPLLTEEELIENVGFLARKDVLLSPRQGMSCESLYDAILGHSDSVQGNAPVFTRVAYMSTELEMFVGGEYAQHVRDMHPELVGDYDPSFARHNYQYLNPKIGGIASWCRVWTEGTFIPIYRLRLLARTCPDDSMEYQRLIKRYRGASFALLAAMTSRLSTSSSRQIDAILATLAPSSLPTISSAVVSVGLLEDLWSWVMDGSAAVNPKEAEFRLDRLGRRRDT